MRLLLIRHGQTIDNVNGDLGTVVPGPLLTDLGQEQARAIPAALADEAVQAIYASTMQRTSLTAAPLATATGVAVEILGGLREIGAGIFEGKSDKDSVRGYMGTIISWWQDSAARSPVERVAMNSSPGSLMRSARWPPHTTARLSYSATVLPSAPGLPRSRETLTKRSVGRMSCRTRR